MKRILQVRGCSLSEVIGMQSFCIICIFGRVESVELFLRIGGSGKAAVEGRVLSSIF